MKLALSIRAVLAGLGTPSVLIASALAGFGLLGVHYQQQARKMWCCSSKRSLTTAARMHS